MKLFDTTFLHNNIISSLFFWKRKGLYLSKTGKLDKTGAEDNSHNTINSCLKSLFNIYVHLIYFESVQVLTVWF